VKPQTVEEARKCFNAADQKGLATWDAKLPIGIRFASAELFRERHPDGFTFTAMFPTGPLVPGSGRDPNEATSFYVRRDGGLAGLSQLSGPFKLEKGGEGKLSAAMVDKLKAAFAGLSSSQIHWESQSLPAGVRFAQAVLKRDPFPDGFTYSALVPAGVLNPNFPPEDPNQAKAFYLQRTGGLAGLEQIAGPFQIDGKRSAVQDAFTAARASSSPRGEMVTRGELVTAFRAALDDDGAMSADEKTSLAQQWASLFDGAQWHATEAAQRAFASLQKRFDLPVILVD
jgi:hypothetical protein